MSCLLSSVFSIIHIKNLEQANVKIMISCQFPEASGEKYDSMGGIVLEDKRNNLLSRLLNVSS